MGKVLNPKCKYLVVVSKVVTHFDEGIIRMSQSVKRKSKSNILYGQWIVLVVNYITHVVNGKCRS